MFIVTYITTRIDLISRRYESVECFFQTLMKKRCAPAKSYIYIYIYAVSTFYSFEWKKLEMK